MKRHYMIYMVCLLSFLCGMSSCTEDFPATGESELHGLVMQLQIDGNPVSAPASRVAADPTMRENVVSHVDVFFSSDGTKIDYYTHAALGTDNRLVLAGADWKTHFPAASYTVYVLANKHDYADETNHLSDIATIEQLKELTDTDAEVNKAEGESSSGNNTYSGKLFFMDGVTRWTPPTDAVDETIEVELYRAAAKFVVNVSFASNEEFNLDDISIISVQKKVVNYMPEAMALKEVTPDYENMEAVMGDASSSNMSNTNYTNGKQGEERKDILYAYAYPNHWGDDAVRETYLLMNVPYSENDEVHNNYYKVPIRFSNDADELHIDRNTQYTVNVTVDRKGNEEIDKSIPLLNLTFNVAAWEPETINVNDDAPSYLILSDYNIEMHNEEEVTIEFFSSSPLATIEGVKIIEAYFINKEGNEQERQNYYYENRNGNTSIVNNHSNVPLTDLCTVEYNKNTLTGKITFTSEYVKKKYEDNNWWAATDVTARYYTLTVTNTDDSPITKEITIVQYPLEYISGVPGVYSTRSDFERTGNTYENYRNKNWVNNVDVNTGGYNPTFKTKVSVNGQTYYIRLRNNQLTYTNDDRVSSLDNNRMYLVQITSTDESYTVARPKMDGEGEDIVTHSSDENNRLVSPAFMLASQLGAVLPSNWNTAQTQCQQYIEYAKADDGTEWRFADWRLPTYEELRIIGKYQNEQPEVMDEVLGGDYYWSAHNNKAWRKSRPDAENPTNDPDGSVYIRCIRDVSPEDLAEFRAHNIR